MDLYLLLMDFALSDVDFFMAFDCVDEPYRTEIFRYLRFLQNRPDRWQFKDYTISKDALKLIINYIKLLERQNRY